MLVHMDLGVSIRQIFPFYIGSILKHIPYVYVEREKYNKLNRLKLYFKCSKVLCAVKYPT